MLTYYKCMYASAVHLKMLSKRVLKSCTVKHGTEPMTRSSGSPESFCATCVKISTGFATISKIPPKFLFAISNDALEDCNIFIYQIKSCLARLLACTCRNNNDSSICHIIITTCIYLHRSGKGIPWLISIASPSALSLSASMRTISEKDRSA